MSQYVRQLPVAICGNSHTLIEGRYVPYQEFYLEVFRWH